MAYLHNDPDHFVDEMVEGFVAANSQFVRRVPGAGVVRNTATPSGQVAVVIGGGSGHYPAFAGLVGQGLAHGAAMGNLFASPSSERVYRVAKAADRGGGVLLAYGNYAGDVLNFDRAQDRLNAEGIACRTIVVTDDVSSAGPDDAGQRRGIAGDLVVFKTAAVAAESGATLQEVVRVAARANDRTRSIGVAFSGCSLPGATAPLFTVPAGRMAVGMGIHGEPGLSETDVPTADDLARLLVDSLLREAPASTPDAPGHVTVLLNGLGSVKYEELYVLYRRVAGLLDEHGVEPVEPEVGELVTSFAMAGVSLTLCWLDEELERLWRAPAYTPAFRKGGAVPTDPLDIVGPATPEVAPQEPLVAAPACMASREAAAVVLGGLEAARTSLGAQADELGRLDAIAGDGDHGIGMHRGVEAAAVAAREACEAGAGAGTALTRAGMAWADRAGGTSGALWGALLCAAGQAMGDDAGPDARAAVDTVEAARSAVAHHGGARVGDKTMLDVLSPFADALRAAVDGGHDLPSAWSAAASVAERAADKTADLEPQVGRARPHKDKSLHHRDPGAVSMASVIGAVAPATAGKGNRP